MSATERAHVAGMSTGGWLAQLPTLSHPERVAALTLIASRPNPPGPVDDDLPGHDDTVMEAIMNTPAPNWSDQEAVIGHLVRQARTFAGAGTFDEASARAHAEAEVAHTTDVQCATTNIGSADHGPRWCERLGDIIAPTLVLHGEDDPFFPIGNGEALAAEIPNARLDALDRVGHQLPDQAVPVAARELIAHTALRPGNRRTTTGSCANLLPCSAGIRGAGLAVVAVEHHRGRHPARSRGGREFQDDAVGVDGRLAGVETGASSVETRAARVVGDAVLVCNAEPDGVRLDGEKRKASSGRTRAR
jgi:hypothetical protein